MRVIAVLAVAAGGVLAAGKVPGEKAITINLEAPGRESATQADSFEKQISAMCLDHIHEHCPCDAVSMSARRCVDFLSRMGHSRAILRVADVTDCFNTKVECKIPNTSNVMTDLMVIHPCRRRINFDRRLTYLHKVSKKVEVVRSTVEVPEGIRTLVHNKLPLGDEHPGEGLNEWLTIYMRDRVTQNYTNSFHVMFQFTDTVSAPGAKDVSVQAPPWKWLEIDHSPVLAACATCTFGGMGCMGNLISASFFIMLLISIVAIMGTSCIFAARWNSRPATHPAVTHAA